MHELLNTLQQFYKMLIAKPLEFTNPKQVAELQRTLKLTTNQIVTNFTVVIRELSKLN